MVSSSRFTFIVVGEHLYRVDTFSGTTWVEIHQQWCKVQEPK